MARAPYSIRLQDPDWIAARTAALLSHLRYVSPFASEDSYGPYVVDVSLRGWLADETGVRRQTFARFLDGHLTRLQVETWGKIAALVERIRAFVATEEDLPKGSRRDDRCFAVHLQRCRPELDSFDEAVANFVLVPSRRALCAGRAHSKRVAAKHR